MDIGATAQGVYDKWKGLPFPVKAVTASLAAVGTLSATTAATVGLAYLIAPKYVKRKGADTLHSGLGVMIGAADKIVEKIPDIGYGGLNARGSISLTGPGIAITHDKTPIMANAHLTGAGLMYRFHPKKLAQWIKRRGWITAKKAKVIGELAPPEMYAGLEVAPYPFAAGVVLDRDNAAETVDRLGKLRTMLYPHTTQGLKKHAQEARMTTIEQYGFLNGYISKQADKDAPMKWTAAGAGLGGAAGAALAPAATGIFAGRWPKWYEWLIGAGGGAAAGAAAGRLALAGTRNYMAHSLIRDPYEYNKGKGIVKKIRETVVPVALQPRFDEAVGELTASGEITGKDTLKAALRLVTPSGKTPGLLHPEVLKEVFGRLTRRVTMDDIDNAPGGGDVTRIRGELAARYMGAFDPSKGSLLKQVPAGKGVDWYPGELSEQFLRKDVATEATRKGGLPADGWRGKPRFEDNVMYIPTGEEGHVRQVPFSQEGLNKLMAGTEPGETRILPSVGEVESNMPVAIKNIGRGRYAVQWADKWDVGLNPGEKVDSAPNALRHFLDKYVAATPPGIISGEYITTPRFTPPVQDKKYGGDPLGLGLLNQTAVNNQTLDVVRKEKDFQKHRL